MPDRARQRERVRDALEDSGVRCAFIDTVVKTNRRGYTQSRVLVVTQMDEVLMCTKSGTINRSIPLSIVAGVTVSHDGCEVLFSVPSQYDLLVRFPDVGSVDCGLLSALHGVQVTRIDVSDRIGGPRHPVNWGSAESGRASTVRDRDDEVSLPHGLREPSSQHETFEPVPSELLHKSIKRWADERFVVCRVVARVCSGGDTILRVLAVTGPPRSRVFLLGCHKGEVHTVLPMSKVRSVRMQRTFPPGHPPVLCLLIRGPEGEPDMLVRLIGDQRNAQLGPVHGNDERVGEVIASLARSCGGGCDGGPEVLPPAADHIGTLFSAANLKKSKDYVPPSALLTEQRKKYRQPCPGRGCGHQFDPVRHAGVKYCPKCGVERPPIGDIPDQEWAPAPEGGEADRRAASLSPETATPAPLSPPQPHRAAASPHPADSDGSSESVRVASFAGGPRTRQQPSTAKRHVSLQDTARELASRLQLCTAERDEARRLYTELRAQTGACAPPIPVPPKPKVRSVGVQACVYVSPVRRRWPEPVAASGSEPQRVAVREGAVQAAVAATAAAAVAAAARVDVRERLRLARDEAAALRGELRAAERHQVHLAESCRRAQKELSAVLRARSDADAAMLPRPDAAAARTQSPPPTPPAPPAPPRGIAVERCAQTELVSGDVLSPSSAAKLLRAVVLGEWSSAVESAPSTLTRFITRLSAETPRLASVISRCLDALADCRDGKGGEEAAEICQRDWRLAELQRSVERLQRRRSAEEDEMQAMREERAAALSRLSRALRDGSAEAALQCVAGCGSDTLSNVRALASASNTHALALRDRAATALGRAVLLSVARRAWHKWRPAVRMRPPAPARVQVRRAAAPSLYPSSDENPLRVAGELRTLLRQLGAAVRPVDSTPPSRHRSPTPGARPRTTPPPSPPRDDRPPLPPPPSPLPPPPSPPSPPWPPSDSSASPAAPLPAPLTPSPSDAPRRRAPRSPQSGRRMPAHAVPLPSSSSDARSRCRSVSAARRQPRSAQPTAAPRRRSSTLTRR
eukprot:TRINITY_DN21244_c0_g1_i1.p1 TRINITY_DN21244_c0_g1~~TRINITY_DN21244_c0_g1_i1.p1  ORF type:complete len:1030 (+),score=266.22 TRINITY_DN21244_c0_g1_i1:70-3159(+)